MYDYLKFEEELEILLAQDVITEWTPLGTGHYRINEVLDVWPRRKKYHLITENKYGTYQNLEKLVS